MNHLFIINFNEIKRVLTSFSLLFLEFGFSFKMEFTKNILIFIRFLSVIFSFIQDCDEVFNYWEPLHYVVFGYGMQVFLFFYFLKRLGNICPNLLFVLGLLSLLSQFHPTRLNYYWNQTKLNYFITQEGSWLVYQLIRNGSWWMPCARSIPNSDSIRPCF